jgi:DNA-binding response OmpR family regulator
MSNSSEASYNEDHRLPRICLLVDDDDDDKEIFCMAMEETDPSIKCLTANDAMEALKMLKDPTFVPDYIFLDLNMPLMSGKECLVEIRKQSHLINVPIIIYTTSASQKDIEDTMEAGATSFITKPPQISILAEKLSEVLNRVNL